ncbi:MAG TPA: hypothetical protein VK806_00190 [Bacteroidia bacterium]|jgi:hypothetical protein|nr:hypothetical protein [Bacteroidia bacterium]
MSYGLKYTLTFRDLVQVSYGGAKGQLWKINIYQNGFSGSSAAIIGDNSPIKLNYKKQDLISPLCGSELTIGLYATTNNQYDEFLTAEPLQYYADILRSQDNGSTYQTYWSGVNTTDTYTESYSNAPYNIQVKFNDGIGELQWHRYENAGALFSGYEQVIQIINNVMAFLPYQKNVREMINIREDTMLDTKGLLEQLYLSDYAFMETGDDGLTHGINCNKLLNNILTSLNCRMYQSNSKWYIERIYERTNNYIQCYDYTITGSITTANTITSSGSGVENKVLVVSNSSFPKITEGSELAVTKKQTSLAYKLNTSQFANLQLINNPYFENTPTSASGKPPLPLRWDRQSGTVSIGGDQIETVDMYATDNRYKWGYSFGANIIEAQRTLLNSTSGWVLGGPYVFPSNYGIHSVLRPGDTWSQPWLYIDTGNGTIDYDIQQFIRIRVSVSATLMTLTELNNAAAAIQGGLSFYPLFQVNYQSPSGTYNRAVGSLDLNLFNTSFPSTANCTLGQNTSTNNGLCYCWYPNNGPIAYPLWGTAGYTQLYNMILFANLRKASFAGGYFDLTFRTDNNFSNNCATLTGGTGVYKFDFKAYPPYYDPTQVNKLCPKISWAINDYALNVVDIEYKDQNYSASSYIGFYQTPDVDLRWNELTVTPVYGDSLTAGYPGVFRVSSGNMTGTWHEYNKPYRFNGTTSAGDPGSDNCSFNNATPASVTHVYINVDDQNTNNDSSWLNNMQTGQSLVVTDTTSAATVTFLIGTITSHSTYYDISVTYQSGTGTFTNGDNALLSYNGGIILADILFENYIQLCGNYRHNIKGKVLGVADYWQTLQDEDGRNYILLGHSLDIKNGQITTDMEEMSDTRLSISKYVGGGPATATTFASFPVVGVPTTPVGVKTTSLVTKSSSITTITSYPL